MVHLHHLLSIAIYVPLNLPMVEGTPLTYRQTADLGFTEPKVRAAIDGPDGLSSHDGPSLFRKAMDMAKKIITGRDETPDVTLESIQHLLDQIENIQEDVSMWLPPSSADDSAILSTPSTTSPSSTSSWDQPDNEYQEIASDQSEYQLEGQLEDITETSSPSSNWLPGGQTNETPQPSLTAFPDVRAKAGTAFTKTAQTGTPTLSQGSASSIAAAAYKSPGPKSGNLTSVFSLAGPVRNSSDVASVYLSKGKTGNKKAKASNFSSLVKVNKYAPNNSTTTPLAANTTPGPQAKATPIPQISPPRGGLNGAFVISPSRWNLTLGTLPRASPGYFEQAFRTRTKKATTTPTRTGTSTVTEFLPLIATPGDLGEEKFIDGMTSVTSSYTAESLAGTPSPVANNVTTPTTPSVNEDTVETVAAAPEIPSHIPNYHSRAPWPNKTATERSPPSGFQTLSKATATVGEQS